MYRLLFTVATITLLYSCQTKPGVVEQQSAGNYYQEPYGNQLHFSPDSMWMNDPNGMFFYAGEYHLFYQHYPDSTVWGPMHWGHAVSTDLVHWEHLPIALYPDSLGLIFSGSAVVDWQNTSGFGTSGESPIVAIFTHHNMEGEQAGRNDFQYQSIAYSTDKGRTWTKYEGNPVVPNPGIRDFRDPKVIWDAASEQWVMVFAAWDRVRFYGSPNLKDWQFLSEFGEQWGTHAGVWECPDLFPMQVEGTAEQKWVLLVSINPGSANGGSGTQYFVGDFDGKEFQIDSKYAEAFGREESYVPDGDIFMDFEQGTYQDWNIEGEAFGDAPAKGKLAGQQAVEGYTGQYLVNSFKGGDASTGKLSSPTFRIAHKFINFQIGGGNDKLRTCMNLVVAGTTVRSSSGGNKEALFWDGWDVSEYIGKEARIEIIDQHTGGWGHINVDQIMFAEEKARPAREKTVWLDYGRDNYAGVTWSDIPEEDGRRLFMGWMSNWDYAQVVPTEKWRSAMTLARELKLRESNKGLRLFSSPVKELEKLRVKTAEWSEKIIEGEMTITEEIPFEEGCIELELAFEMERATQFEVIFSNNLGQRYSVGYDRAVNQFYSDRTKSGAKEFSSVFANKAHVAPRASDEATIVLHLIIDKAAAEIFADEGQTVITDIFFPGEAFSKIELKSKNGNTKLKKLKAYSLNSIWAL